MPEVRTTRIYRDEYESDDDRSTISRNQNSGSYRTVHRYRVTPSRVEEIDDDRRSSRLEVVPRSERFEIDRTRYVDGPERPRSAIGIGPRQTVVERYVEREREPIREPERERERTRTVVYERNRRDSETDRDRPWERGPSRPWESERDVRETDFRIEKRTERREERRDDYEVERYQKETEYYDRPEPPPAPIIIRQRAQEPQQIVIQEAAPLPPIVLPREEIIVRQEVRQQEVPRPEPREHREHRRQEDEYYYRRDVREVGGPRRSDEEFALVNRREVRPRDSVSDREYSDDEGYVRRTVVKKERSRSRSPHHKRHLAEGALAGAGAMALIANHREKMGDAPEHRGRKVLGGAALGAIGAEVITRARSRYRESREDDDSRSRSSSRHSHRKIKTALGLAAAGLAAAAAAKYVSNRRANNNNEEGRGRSRTRSVSRRRGSGDYYSDYSDRERSQSKHRNPKKRAASIAKAGAATAAIAGVVEHFRDKSRQRSGERSKSRIRKGAEIAGAGLAGAAVAGLYERRKAKEEEDDDDDRKERRRSRTRSRSRARSVGAYSDPAVDPELGMVQYGTEPVYTAAPGYAPGYDPAAAAYSATRDRRRDYSSDGSERDHPRKSKSKSRSRSRVRDIAGAAAGTAAAAIGINQYKKRREKKEAEQRERERRRYEEETPPAENYYARDYNDEDRYTPSPPHASGGSYYPENGQFAPPPIDPHYQQPYTHNNQSTHNVNEIPPHPPIPPYNPADYAGQAPVAHDPYGYPPRTGDNVSSNPNIPSQNPNAGPTMSGGLDPNYYPPPQDMRGERVSEEARLNPTRDLVPLSPTPPDSPAKSVMFAPLSPTSSRRLAQIHETSNHNHQRNPDPDPSHSDSDPAIPPSTRRRKHRRRRHERDRSDPSSNRPTSSSLHRRRHRTGSRSPSPSSSDETVVLPDRYDRDGRPIDGTRGGGGTGGQSEMVEKWARDFGDVLDGRRKWRDLLGDLVEGVQAAGASGSSSRSGKLGNNGRWWAGRAAF